jgi:hypothetical protein
MPHLDAAPCDVKLDTGSNDTSSVKQHQVSGSDGQEAFFSLCRELFEQGHVSHGVSDEKSRDTRAYKRRFMIGSMLHRCPFVPPPEPLLQILKAASDETLSKRKFETLMLNARDIVRVRELWI